MLLQHPRPDYRRFIDAMWRREPDRVPLAEIGIDTPVKEKLLGRPVTDVRSDVEFWCRAGYDYIYLRAAYEFPNTMPANTTTGTPHYGDTKEREEKSIGSMGPGVISGFADLDTYPWPNPATEDFYAPLDEASECMPEGMGLVSGVGGIFTRAWMLLGFERFCFALNEEPELVAELFRRIGSIQLAVLKRIMKTRRLVAIWYGDDLAYTESMMVAPEVYRRHLFPWMEEFAAIAHAAGMPFIFHSDGKLWDVIPDLIALGLNGLHPIEPKAMDINEVKARYGHKLALLGNIDMNLLAMGTPEQVKAEVRRRIRDLAPGGGYAVGVNPGVAYYVKLENYNAMRETVFEYGHYPIKL